MIGGSSRRCWRTGRWMTLKRVWKLLVGDQKWNVSTFGRVAREVSSFIMMQMHGNFRKPTSFPHWFTERLMRPKWERVWVKRQRVQTLWNAYLWNRWMDLVLWTCLDLQLCTVTVTCPFAPMAQVCQMRQHLGQTSWKPYLWNRWMDLYHSKLYGIV